jgi:hypothetical protein
MTDTKKDSGKKQNQTEEKADAPAADPGRQPDADAIKTASGEAVKGESGNQEDWRERHGQEGEVSGA